jgi:hypothetical protein
VLRAEIISCSSIMLKAPTSFGVNLRSKASAHPASLQALRHGRVREMHLHGVRLSAVSSAPVGFALLKESTTEWTRRTVKCIGVELMGSFSSNPHLHRAAS